MNSGFPVSKWNTLKILMNGNGNFMDTIGFRPDFLSSYTFTNVAQPNMITHVDIPVGYNLPLPASAGGGTNFANAIQRAINIISFFRYENTCFMMITDGEAPYPGAQVNALRNLLASIRRRGCRTCVRCYFIQHRFGAKIPIRYARLCKRLGASIITAPPKGFNTKFINDLKSYEKQLVRKWRSDDLIILYLPLYLHLLSILENIN